MLLILLAGIPGAAQEKAGAFYWQGALYQDWMGFKGEGDPLFSRLSTRLRLTFWNRPGNGWTMFFDVRNRFASGEGVENQLLVYDARLAYDSLKSKIFLSLGWMNLYDTAGIGQLAGIMTGYKFGRYLSAGAYGGLQTDIYAVRINSLYQKFGIFARYIGPGARQFSLSYNLVRFESLNERQFVYSSLLLPLGRFLIVYGNGEYELNGNTHADDRLSRLFVNARANLSRHADVTASYSSGRGMDYHRFLLEQSQDPSLQNSEMERFYYNKTYGLRLSLTPLKNLRLHVARQESELQDAGIKNHTAGFGLAAGDILHSGLSFYGNYNLNRGDSSEADTYYLSLARNFGKLAVNLSYANFFNGVRFSAAGTPQLIRIELPKQQTFSGDLFLAVNRTLAVSLSYSYLVQAGYSDQQFFVRLIARK
ncbi:MAG: hypothetical protein E4H23_04230 [Chrysiogenales bacterium]|nr:hypothetical protein [Candidatus Aminicenantes bacterium]TFG79940.1 MAG: hypothetical protein E4H23_04230 [Chrysiogenales bacterium]